jgi:hypothetical protein
LIFIDNISRSLHSPTCSTWIPGKVQALYQDVTWIPGIFQVFLEIGFGRDPQPYQTWSAPEFDLDFQVYCLHNTWKSRHSRQLDSGGIEWSPGIVPMYQI